MSQQEQYFLKDVTKVTDNPVTVMAQPSLEYNMAGLIKISQIEYLDYFDVELNISNKKYLQSIKNFD